MGFASGSVVPLPTANSHAREEYLMKPAFQKATSFPRENRQYAALCVTWHTPASSSFRSTHSKKCQGTFVTSQTGLNAYLMYTARSMPPAE